MSTPLVPPERGVFCNRTLNFARLKAVGYDMDYTLVHYHVHAWEKRVYEYVQTRLVEMGIPIGEHSFDPDMIVRGLILDVELGNVVKANRFGFVRKAMHGTRVLSFEEQRKAYARTVVDLADPRWVFLNTLFSLSEGCLYAQLVDLLDEERIKGPMGYRDLYGLVRSAMDKTHVQGELKAEIMADPARFVLLDEETPLALLDQKHSGKKLLLVTNSEWAYTRAMMTYAFDPFLPAGMTWRELFDIVVVGARKPEFFTARPPFFEVVTDDGLLRPALSLEQGKAYLGGSAQELERHLGISGEEFLYVGDHMFGDVHVTNRVLRWRTALILRELEDEVRAITEFASQEIELGARMQAKEALEIKLAQARLALLRKRSSYGPVPAGGADVVDADLEEIRAEILDADEGIAPLARRSGALANPTWGLLTRAGNDKSHLARQIERYADVYTSRVANFMHATPYIYLRAPRGSLPHDPVQMTTPTHPESP